MLPTLELPKQAFITGYLQASAEIAYAIATRQESPSQSALHYLSPPGRPHSRCFFITIIQVNHLFHHARTIARRAVLLACLRGVAGAEDLTTAFTLQQAWPMLLV
eukprot:1144162-Pelagomonas_calceolata.AAC.7